MVAFGGKFRPNRGEEFLCGQNAVTIMLERVIVCAGRLPVNLFWAVR